MLVDDVALQGGEQESTKPTARRIGSPDILPLEKTREEPLRQVLRLLDSVTASAKVAVERRPVDLTELSKGCGGVRIGPMPGSIDHRPPRGRESASRCHTRACSHAARNARASLGRRARSVESAARKNAAADSDICGISGRSRTATVDALLSPANATLRRKGGGSQHLERNRRSPEQHGGMPAPRAARAD